MKGVAERAEVGMVASCLQLSHASHVSLQKLSKLAEAMIAQRSCIPERLLKEIGAMKAVRCIYRVMTDHFPPVPKCRRVSALLMISHICRADLHTTLCSMVICHLRICTMNFVAQWLFIHC